MALWGGFLGTDWVEYIIFYQEHRFQLLRNVKIFLRHLKKTRMVERSSVFVWHYSCFLLHRFFRNTCEVPNVHFDLPAPGRIGQNSHCRKMTWHHLANDSLHLCEMRYFGFVEFWFYPKNLSNSSRNFGFFPFWENIQNKNIYCNILELLPQ